MAKLVGTVRWLKAFDGMPEHNGVVAVLPSLRSRLMEMGADLAGSQNALAVYIKQKPNTDYWNGKSLPGAIAGLVWLAPLPKGLTVDNFAEDKRYPLGWPIADAVFHQGEYLRDLVRRAYGSTFTAAWNAMPLSLKDGKPFRIDSGAFARVGDELTNFYQSI